MCGIFGIANPDMLPRNIIERKTRGFGTPMGAWLKQELAPLMQDLLSDESVNARGLFHADAVKSLIAKHAANVFDGTDRLLALMNLEIWARIYLDHRSPRDVTAQLEEALA